MMDSVGKIITLIPKYKQQLVFLKEREKLFKTNDDYSTKCIGSPSTASSNFSTSSISSNLNSSTASSNFNLTSISSNFNSPSISSNLNSSAASSNFSSSSISSNFNSSIASSNFNSSSISSNFNSPSISSSFNSSRSSLELIPDDLSKDSSSNSTSDRELNKSEPNESLPDKYIIPSLPSALLKDIEDRAMQKFGPHFSNRQIFVDTIAHDLINTYNLFYPSHKQFDAIGIAMVEFLKLPPTKQNIGIWKDALQTKLKRKRAEHKDNIDVLQYRMKYARVGSGRPIKKRIGEVAQRDHQKQVMLAVHDDITLSDIQTKAEKLRDICEADVYNQLQLWRETVHIRRQYIREHSTSDVLKEFPGYSYPILVKIITKTDLSGAIIRQIPTLLEKLVSTPVFVTDSSPIRLLKLLCRQFDETIHHIFCNTEPSTPYPTLVCIDDLIHVYVDFIPVISTTSPDDALALLIGMYSIFELCFNKNSRSIRLLYSVLHADIRFLPNTLRIFIKEKQIDIYDEKNRKDNIPLNISSKNSTTVTVSQCSTQIEAVSTYTSSIEKFDTNNYDLINANDFPVGFDLNSSIITNEDSSAKPIQQNSSILIDSQNKKKEVRKRSKRIAKTTQERSKSFVLSDIESQENEQPLNNKNSFESTAQNKRRRRV